MAIALGVREVSPAQRKLALVFVGLRPQRVCSSKETATQKQKPPLTDASGGSKKKSGDDLLSRYTHYHRPRLLNGRVRNGNGCDQPGMLTGKFKRCWEEFSMRAEKRNNADKRLAVSTG